jgi:glycosyltransferase involved in cell wall biosynthesis
MKLLHIIQGSVGGTLEYLKLLIPRLKNLGYENKVICQNEICEELNTLSIETYKIEMSREISIKDDLISLMKILKVLKSYRPDICYLHSSKAGALGRLACFLTRTKCVYNPHGWSFAMQTGYINKLFYAFIEKSLSFLCSRIILISDAELSIAKNYHIAPENKLITIYNGIDIDKFSEALAVDRKTILNSNGKNIVIGMVGRLTEQKDPLMFVKISAEILKVIKNAKFILVGDGNLREKTLSLAKELGVSDNLILTGWVKDPESYIKAFDVAVLTSKWEGFGLVLAEYMAAGKPIVASNIDGIPCVITDRFDGLLATPGDVSDFVAKILSIINDRNLSDKLIKNAKNTVKTKFSVDRVILEHAQLFNKLMIHKIP